MDKIIAIEKALDELTPELKDKLTKLNTKFKQRFNESPLFYARAPGRVNLIGEHIDYCGYSVFPMAISNDIFMAVSLNTTNMLNLTNVDDSFEDYTISTVDFLINKDKPYWHNYFLCGLQGIKEKFTLENPIGINVCIYGTVPKSSGLSSSSALVVCAALVTLYANKLEFTKTELAELCAVSERYIGTQGGGMDQAISCLAKAGTAKLIDFNPLRVTDVTLPDGSLFVITNSCVEMNKAATNHFNKRVVECRLAAQILAKQNSLEWRNIKKFLDLQKVLNYSLKEMIILVEKNLHQNAYSKTEICELLGVSADELATTSLSANTLEITEFDLYKRALHVFSEAQRVYDFKDTCSLKSDDALKKLGELMNQSHESCSKLYNCSCDELDDLTQICRDAGAYGSRLTGAGWGGCAVSLIPDNILNEFLNKIKINYYSKNANLEQKFPVAAFATTPSDGICILKLN